MLMATDDDDDGDDDVCMLAYMRSFTRQSSLGGLMETVGLLLIDGDALSPPLLIDFCVCRLKWGVCMCRGAHAWGGEARGVPRRRRNQM